MYVYVHDLAKHESTRQLLYKHEKLPFLKFLLKEYTLSFCERLKYSNDTAG